MARSLAVIPFSLALASPSSVGEHYGDGYLFLGAPRTARLPATIDF